MGTQYEVLLRGTTTRYYDEVLLRGTTMCKQDAPENGFSWGRAGTTTRSAGPPATRSRARTLQRPPQSSCCTSYHVPGTVLTPGHAMPCHAQPDPATPRAEVTFHSICAVAAPSAPFLLQTCRLRPAQIRSHARYMQRSAAQPARGTTASERDGDSTGMGLPPRLGRFHIPARLAITQLRLVRMTGHYCTLTLTTTTLASVSSIPPRRPRHLSWIRQIAGRGLRARAGGDKERQRVARRSPRRPRRKKAASGTLQSVCVVRR